jgi:hypothetical protein
MDERTEPSGRGNFSGINEDDPRWGEKITDGEAQGLYDAFGHALGGEHSRSKILKDERPHGGEYIEVTCYADAEDGRALFVESSTPLGSGKYLATEATYEVGSGRKRFQKVSYAATDFQNTPDIPHDADGLIDMNEAREANEAFEAGPGSEFTLANLRDAYGFLELLTSEGNSLPKPDEQVGGQASLAHADKLVENFGVINELLNTAEIGSRPPDLSRRIDQQ